MIAGKNFAVFNSSRIDVPQMQGLAPAIAGPGHFQHLVEVAVENFAEPTDIDCVAAHQAVHGRRIKSVVQQCHIIGEQVVVLQVGSKPGDGQVRDRVELVEDDPEMFFQLALVVGFELRLGPGEESAIGILDQME